MALIDELKLKNVSVEDFHTGEKNLHKQWEQKFAGDLSNSEKKKIYLYQFLWHIFSYEKVEHLCGQDAIEAFNSIKKDECYVFYQRRNKVLKLNNAKDITAEDFNREQDIYLIDKHMSWTYVHTHEESCGPYFYKINS